MASEITRITRQPLTVMATTVGRTEPRYLKLRPP